MSERIQTVRGMHDVLPGEVHEWHAFESSVRSLMAAYGYREIRTPVLERTELFQRSLGEVTDIVEKEMFTFVDREKGSLSLRPEATASCVRSGIEHGFLYQSPVRLWYTGPMFRHERPQKGRYRQFHQVGIEAFGFPGVDIELEVIAIGQRLWRMLGVAGHVRLEINSLGTPAERAAYRRDLVAYLERQAAALDEDSRRRLQTNPLRILDSKNPGMQEVIAGAPALWDSLGGASRAHFEDLRALLDAVGIDYVVAPRLVRGLDYYTHTVFEWVTERLGAQSAVCAGGRYDGLVEQLGGRPTPGIGFAMGIERLLLLVAQTAQPAPAQGAHAYLLFAGEEALRDGLVLAERLRDEVAGLQLLVHCGGGSMKSQMKKADRSGARVALILGPDELARGEIVYKPLREQGAQETIAMGALDGRLRALVDGAVLRP